MTPRSAVHSTFARVTVCALVLAVATSLAPTAASAQTRAPRRSTTTAPAAVHAACIAARPLAAGDVVEDSTAGSADRFHAQCGDGTASPDAVYRLHVAAPSRVVLQLEADYDAVLQLRSECERDASELACNDDTGDARHSYVDTSVEPGDYFVVVDGYRSANAGHYALHVSVTPSGTPTAALIAPSSSASPDPATSSSPADVSSSRLFTGPAVITGDGAAEGIDGLAVFAKRLITPRGLSANTVDRPAPRFHVDALGLDGAVVAQGETDDEGRFHLAVSRGASVRVRVVSRTAYLGNDLRVVDQPVHDRLYEVSTDYFVVRGGDRVRLRADVGGDEPAGAFNILAGFVHMLPFVQRGFGHALPPLFAFWKRGNNQSLPVGYITAFIRQYRAHPGAFALQVMGGEQGREDISDSDHFDDPIILHEFTHFVIDTMVGNFSTGGPHGWSELHINGLALNEAVASVVAGAVIGDARYWDTMGVEPHGRVVVDVDQESMIESVRGVGSEATNQMIQWDLVDGAEGIPDRDGDGIALGLSGLFRLYASFHDDRESLPDIVAILERGIQLGMFTRAQATALLLHPEAQGFTLPPTGLDIYPADVALGSRTVGKIDGQTQPAPSGGRNVPSNGFDANRLYRLRVTAPHTLRVRLRIEGDGTQESGTDLDLAVFGHDYDIVGVSDGVGPLENVTVQVQPGTYFIWVRDGDQSRSSETVGTAGNRANFTLEVD